VGPRAAGAGGPARGRGAGAPRGPAVAPPPPPPPPRAAARRGVYQACRLELTSAAPFGLLWWSRTITVPLVRPLLVAPRPGTPDRSVLEAARSQADEGRRVGARVGEPRSVRPYQVGDLRHWVHWPATAHSRTLMVREMEGPLAQPLTVRAVLPDDPDAADHQAGQALATVAELLAAGRTVRLETIEARGQRDDEVATIREAGRRLALALPEVGLRR